MRWTSRDGATALLLLATLVWASACATPQGSPRRLAYTEPEFEAELRRRIPELPDRLARPPYAVDAAVIERGRRHLLRAPVGPERIERLVAFLSLEAPKGLGLAYDWQTTGTARATLERGRGNCVSLAMVLVGIGRGLGWPVYFVQIHTKQPETKEFTSLRAVSDHMAVLIAVSSYSMIVDFTGRIDEMQDLRVIDDVTAYAHVLNNLAAGRVMLAAGEPTDADWDAAIQGFELAARLQPDLGRAWNNLGIALSRRGRYEEAREMYRRAVALDTSFGAAERNLTVMETRAEGAAQVLAAPLAEVPRPGDDRR